jgi:hypothetical protein
MIAFRTEGRKAAQSSTRDRKRQLGRLSQKDDYACQR